MLEYSHIQTLADDSVHMNDSILGEFVGCGLQGEENNQGVINTIDLSSRRQIE